MNPLRRALLVGLAILGCLFIFRATRQDERIKNNLPKPGPVRFTVSTDQPSSKFRLKPAPSSNSQIDSDSSRNVRLTKQAYDYQSPISDTTQRSLRDQLAYQHPYDLETKFPAYIWQTWKANPSSGAFAEQLRVPEASWTELHPSFIHEVITDNVAVHLIRHFYASVPEVVQAYEALPIPVVKADFFRYLILLARGGIYSDIDTKALQPATDWVPESLPRSAYGLVVGIEADPDREDWHEWYSRRVQLCQWTIQAKAGHPVLVDVVANITEETLKRQAEGRLKSSTIKDVVEFTGPALWTDAIFRYLNNPAYFDMQTSSGNITWEHFTGMKTAKRVGDVVILPITSFSPGIGHMGAGEDDDPMAFVKHEFEGELFSCKF